MKIDSREKIFPLSLSETTHNVKERRRDIFFQHESNVLIDSLLLVDKRSFSFSFSLSLCVIIFKRLMSSSSVIDFLASTPIVHDETSNQSIEIPEPPTLTVTHIAIDDDDAHDHQPVVGEKDNSESEEETLPMNITFDWLYERMRAGVDLRPIFSRILPGLPNDVSQATLFNLLMDLFSPVQQRQPLEQYKTLDDAVELIRKCQNILVLTGAGISVSCGSKSFDQ